jgi:hypothetical protein
VLRAVDTQSSNLSTYENEMQPENCKDTGMRSFLQFHRFCQVPGVPELDRQSPCKIVQPHLMTSSDLSLNSALSHLNCCLVLLNLRMNRARLVFNQLES